MVRHADHVLSNKLVPATALALIPQTVAVLIACEFPSNAEGAQSEMTDAAIEAARRGLTIVRETQSSMAAQGKKCSSSKHVDSNRSSSHVPSASPASIFAGIPVTQCGIGRKGKEVKLPGYARVRPVIMLMGVARIAQVAMHNDGGSGEGLHCGEGRREGRLYLRHTPIAIIECGSISDQRVVASTLGDICEALDCAGDQRSSGMMVVGWAVLALQGTGDTSVLEEWEG